MEVQPAITLRDVFPLIGPLNLAWLFILGLIGLLIFGFALRLRGERRTACGNLLLTLALTAGIYGGICWAFALSEEYQRRSANSNATFPSDVFLAQIAGLWKLAAFSLQAIALLVGAGLVKLIEFVSLQKAS